MSEGEGAAEAPHPASDAEMDNLPEEALEPPLIASPLPALRPHITGTEESPASKHVGPPPGGNRCLLQANLC